MSFKGLLRHLLQRSKGTAVHIASGAYSAIGVLGLVMRRFDIAKAPVLVGMILGPMVEAQTHNAISISEGCPEVFLTRPMLLSIIELVAVTFHLLSLLKYHPERLRQGRHSTAVELSSTKTELRGSVEH